MLIKQCKGYELEKEKPNTSEDYFNRSELTYVENGVEKTLHVLYLRYYEENFAEYTPFDENPIFNVEGWKSILKIFFGIICLLKNPGLRHRKRIYINTEREFKYYFQDVNFEKIKDLLTDLIRNQSAEIKSPLQFIAD